MSWEALGRDPVPGDPAAVEGLAGRFEAVRDGAEAVTGRLRTVDDGTGPDAWTGPAAEAFRDLLAEAGPQVTKLADAHDRAAGALRVYATALDSAQQDARRAETDAERAVADRTAAQARHHQADADAATWTRAAADAQQRLTQAQTQRAAAADPVYAAQLDAYLQATTAQRDQARATAGDLRGQAAAAGRDASAASDRLSAAKAAAERAAHDREEAGKRLVQVLRAVTPEESLWSRLVKDTVEAVHHVVDFADDVVKKLEQEIAPYHRGGKELERWKKGWGFLRREFKLTASTVTKASKKIAVLNYVLTAYKSYEAGQEQGEEDARRNPQMSSLERRLREDGAALAIATLGGAESLAGTGLTEAGAFLGGLIGGLFGEGVGAVPGAIAGALLGTGLSAEFEEKVKDLGYERAVREFGAEVGSKIYDALKDVAGKVADSDPLGVLNGAADTMGAAWKTITSP